MAAGQLKRTRREVLGAAVALPVAAGVGPLTSPLHRVARGSPPRPGEDKRWRLLLSALEGAVGALRGAEGAMTGLPFAEAEALQEAYDARVEAFENALRRVIGTPAPDAAGFAFKVVLAIDQDVGTLAGGEACLRALRRDALRFAQSGTSSEG